MKYLLLYFVCIAISSTAFSQIQQGIVVNNNPFYQLPALQIPTSTIFKAYTIRNRSTFSIYNEITGLNDTYNSSESDNYYSAPVFVHSNKYRGVKIDSFNPHGSHDIGNAVVSGLFSLLF